MTAYNTYTHTQTQITYVHTHTQARMHAHTHWSVVNIALPLTEAVNLELQDL